MKKELEKGVQMSVWISQDEVRRIEGIAKKARVSRSRFVRNLVLMGLQDAELLDAVGVITLMVKAEDLKDAFKRKRLVESVG